MVVLATLSPPSHLIQITSTEIISFEVIWVSGASWGGFGDPEQQGWTHVSCEELNTEIVQATTAKRNSNQTFLLSKIVQSKTSVDLNFGKFARNEWCKIEEKNSSLRLWALLCVCKDQFALFFSWVLLVYHFVFL